MTEYPLGFIAHLGGVVSAHSVKLLGRINNPDEPETRDAWWTEIRMEIRSHARALACNVVLGYAESTSICDDICILSASGTAAIVCLYHAEAEANRRDTLPLIPSTPSSVEKKENERPAKSDCFLTTGKTRAVLGDMEKEELVLLMSGGNMVNQCSVCHIPYSEASIPFPVVLAKCALCKKNKVPDVLFTTVAPPPGVPVTGKGCLIQARVCRMKKDSKNELNAKEISDSLPFLQYELHRQLLNKLKVKGMNALFGLRVQVSVGAKMLVAVATATAVFLTALPAPQVPRISSGKSTDGSKLHEIQRLIADTILRNQDLYHLQPATQEVEIATSKEEEEEDDESEDDLPELDLSCGNKDACILEIDDSEDADIISLLIDPRIPDGFDMVNIGFVPGVDCIARNLQMFTRVCRTKLPSSTLSCRQLSQYFENITQSLYFKLRKMTPCALVNLQYTIELPDDDELQVTVLGMAVGIGDPTLDRCNAKIELSPLKPPGNFDPDIEPIPRPPIPLPRPFIKNPRPSSRVKLVYHTVMKGERYGIDITPLAIIPGAPIERYLGNLNFFFIRESTSIRENGGLSGFVQSFIAEVLAIVRAHVAALGGNAMVAYFMSECVLLHNPHKNQGQCLINVGGDVVQAFNSLQLLTPHSAPLPDTTSAVTCRVPLHGSPKEPKAVLIGSQG